MAEPGHALALPASKLSELQVLSEVLVRSGFFRGVTKPEQAAAKILAGYERGLGPMESLSSFYVIDGKVEVSADFLAQRVKGSDKYDYRVREHTDEKCELEFFELHEGAESESLGFSTFTIEDARRAGLLAKESPWKTYPRNMLFARAMSNGVAWLCPDVATGGRLYVEGEISGEYQEPATVTSIVDVAPVIDERADGALVLVDGNTGEVLEEHFEPASRSQLNHLFALAGELGIDDDARKTLAGVASFNDLSRNRASELIEDWKGLLEHRQRTRSEGSSAPGDVAAASAAPSVDADDLANRSDSGGEEDASTSRPLDVTDGSGDSDDSRMGKARAPDDPDPSVRTSDGGGGEDDPSIQTEDSSAGMTSAPSEPPHDPSEDRPATDEQWIIARGQFSSDAAIVRAVAFTKGGSVKKADVTIGDLKTAIVAKLERKVTTDGRRVEK